MKKIVIGTLMALAAVASFAGDVTVSAVRDNTVAANGVRVEMGVPVVPGALKASVTSVDSSYTRLAVGKDFSTQAGKVKLSAGVAGVYQITSSSLGANGYGLTVGVGAAYPVTKNITLVAGVERFYGQEKVEQFNGNVATVGMNVKF